MQYIAHSLIDKLQAIRTELNEPIRILSGLRCHERQMQLKESGMQTAEGISQHELGNAADICASNMPALLLLVDKHFKAVGLARSFYHVDLRSDKTRRWKYV